MKIRTDFVTNSSSSSFVCEICGHVESGWDISLRDAGMMKCVNGHIFCCDEALETLDKKTMIKMILENEWNYNGEAEEDLDKIETETLWEEYCSEGGYYDVPECVCPICQFIEYSEYDLSSYLLKKYQIPRDNVFSEVKKLNKRKKKLYEHEYITYVCKEFDLNPTEIVAEWKEKFGTYKKFIKWLRE